MTDIRKSDVFEKGTLSFFYTDADSWRLGRVTDVEDKAGTQTIHLVSCNEDGEDDEEAMQVAGCRMHRLYSSTDLLHTTKPQFHKAVCAEKISHISFAFFVFLSVISHVTPKSFFVHSSQQSERRIKR